jgi:short-subunit dehydrogenase
LDLIASYLPERIDSPLIIATSWLFDEKLENYCNQLNVKKKFLYPHFALPHLVKSRGQIVAVSSLAGLTGVPHRTAYAASKFALKGFFDSLRIELEPAGVAVTLIAPGFVRSAIRMHALGPDGQPLNGSHLRESEVMPVEECVRRMLPAIRKRQRELVLRKWARVIGVVKAIAPGVIDGVAARTMERGT